MSPGVGYWINLPEPTVTTVNGTPPSAEHLNRFLASRWNMVGTGPAAVDVATLKQAFPAVISAYGFDRRYVQPAALVPGRGYWLNMAWSGGVDLSGSTGPNAPSKTVAVAPLAGQTQLWVEGPEAAQLILLGVAEENVVELPPVPPSGLFDARVDLDGQASAWQVPDADGSWRLRLQGQVQRLRWSGPSATAWRVTVDGTPVDLAGVGQLDLGPDADVRVERVTAPVGSTALQECFPNPFNPSTTVRYDLAQSAEVQLRVFSATGQLVRQLVAGPQAAGAYQVVWDGRGGDAQAVANGVYFCELRAGDYRAVRRMLLMK